MGVYIKGMEMPKDRGVYIAIDIDGQVYTKPLGALEWRRLEQKAVPVPPHGDLIDRKPFIQFIKTHWDSYDQWFVEQLEARPTIIPAEEGE